MYQHVGRTFRFKLSMYRPRGEYGFSAVRELHFPGTNLHHRKSMKLTGMPGLTLGFNQFVSQHVKPFWTELAAMEPLGLSISRSISCGYCIILVPHLRIFGAYNRVGRFLSFWIWCVVGDLVPTTVILTDTLYCHH